jgi:TonB family protein
VVAAAAVVPLSFALPAWTVQSIPLASAPIPVSSAAPYATAVAESTTPATPPRNSLPIVVLIWAAGAIAGAAALAGGLGRLARLTANATQIRDARWTRLADRVSADYAVNRKVVLLQTESPDALATWGVLKPCVLLPVAASDWTDERVDVVLRHELAHISRQDWLMQTAAEILRTLYWFNPLMSIACTRLRRDSEQACDDAVLRSGVPARTYAGHLLDLARICRRPGLTGAFGTPMARSSTLERRIAAMLDANLDRRTLSGGAVLVTAAILLAVTLPVGAFRPAQDSPLPLKGSVYDPTGAVIPNVEMTLSKQGDGDQQGVARATTDGTGHFEFPNIAAGKYVLEASLPGFRSLRQDFELKNSRDWDRAITLQIGELQETISVRAQRVAPSVSATPTPVPPIRVGGAIRAPTKLVDVKPVYPATMRAAGREGAVSIEATIGRDGKVASLRVLTGQVHPDFAVAAADAVRQWQFSPTLLNGEPVDVVMTVSVTFSLAE